MSSAPRLPLSMARAPGRAAVMESETGERVASGKLRRGEEREGVETVVGEGKRSGLSFCFRLEMAS